MKKHNMTMLPQGLQAGTWAVTHGSGFIGCAIRNAELAMTKSDEYPDGNRIDSWAGHCVIYAGHQILTQGKAPEPAIVSATYPNVRLVSAYTYSDAVWAIRQPLTSQQRLIGTNAALAMVGMKYDVAAYGYFVEKVLRLTFFDDLNALFSTGSKAGPICSGTVVREQVDMGVDIGPLRTAATKNPDFVAPVDVAAWGRKNGWMSAPYPAW